MRLVILYAALALFFNIIFSTFPEAGRFASRGLTKFIVLVSYPTTKVLSWTQNLINNYVILINTQRENKNLKEKLAKCELYANILKKELKDRESEKETFRLIEAPFTFKSNFKTDFIFLRINKNIDLNKDYCFVLSNKLSLIGIISKKTGKNIYSAKTVFNPNFTADVSILSNNKRYKALFIGNPYKPKAEFLDPNVQINKGDSVYTSGDFGVYPPGLFIGTVESIKNVNGYYKVAYLNIDRDFFNNWKVFVLCKKR